MQNLEQRVTTSNLKFERSAIYRRVSKKETRLKGLLEHVAWRRRGGALKNHPRYNHGSFQIPQLTHKNDPCSGYSFLLPGTSVDL